MYTLRIHTCETILLEKIYDKYKSMDHGFHREEEKWTRVREECIEHFPSIDNSITWIILLFCLAAASAKSLQSCPTLCDPRDGSPRGTTTPHHPHPPNPPTPSLGFSRQEHWSGLPFLSPMHESEK